MATRKLTKTIVHSLAPRDKVYIVYDDSLRGFGVRVTPNGARSWIVEYRPHGGGRGVGKRRITLGSVEVLSADQAREADLAYKPGRSKSWVKIKNRKHPAMLRVQEAFELERQRELERS